jgi:hypothetical protein
MILHKYLKHELFYLIIFFTIYIIIYRIFNSMVYYQVFSNAIQFVIVTVTNNIYLITKIKIDIFFNSG